MTTDTYKIGSEAYCDISNDEAVTANDLYEKFFGKSADGVGWPENATEEQIRIASQMGWERKLIAAGYSHEN